MKKKKQLLKAIRIIAILLILFAVFKGIFLLFILIVLSLAMSYIVNNYGLRQLGLELVTLIAVLTGLKYGPWTALIITFVLITYHMIAGGFIANYVFWVIPAYCIAAVLAGFFPQVDIVKLGIYATLGINLNNIFFTAVTSPTYLPKYLPFAVTNVIFNVILFSVFGTPLLLLMM